MVHSCSGALQVSTVMPILLVITMAGNNKCYVCRIDQRLGKDNSGRGWRNAEPERRVKAVMLDHLLGLSWSAREEEDPQAGRRRGVEEGRRMFRRPYLGVQRKKTRTRSEML